MKKNGINRHQPGTPFRMTRRQLLAGVGAATIAGSMGAVGQAIPASAATNVQRFRRAPSPAKQLPGNSRAPSPIPGGVDLGEPIGLIHWFLPGPEGSVTPFGALEAMGLDVEPSSLTDFQGFTAFAVIAGQAEGSDGNIYNVEFDVRVMEGEYIAEDGSNQHGVFGFF